MLLLRTSFLDPSDNLWVDLLESVLAETGLGTSCSLDTVIPFIKSGKWPKPQNVQSVKNLSFDFSITHPDEPQDADKMLLAKQRLLAWAYLEQFAGQNYSPLFSRVVGGLRPLVYVFDDYNNYISKSKDGCFTAESTVSDEVREMYKLPKIEKEDEFLGVLEGYCSNLNNLQMFCEVVARKLWIKGSGKPDYEQVARALPFDELDRQREQIAAFLVDLEWLPTLGKSENDAEWSSMGYRAIRLLSLRYPEIPCFVMTGERAVTKLQEALSHGASWCYKKVASHHAYAGDKEDNKANWLTALGLERGLRVAKETHYGAFRELPYADQLNMDSKHEASKKLAQALKIELPLGRCNPGKTFQRLIARVFPDGGRITPEKVMSGKSKAKATFFVGVSHGKEKELTQFLKVGGWIPIQKEYAAYQRTIRPRIGSYVAHIMSDPIIAEADGVDMHWGALVYSTAGLPSAHDDLRSLEDLLRNNRMPTQDIEIRIKQTLIQVLRNLHDINANKKDRRPLSAWLGWLLPPMFTGKLVPLHEQDADPDLASWKDKGFKLNTASMLAALDVKKLSAGGRCKLTGFYLDDVEWSETRDCELTLTHPDLGFRVRLSGSSDDIRRRFGALWVRPGMPVNVVAQLDIREENKEYKKILNKVDSAAMLVMGDMKHQPTEIMRENMLDAFFKLKASKSGMEPKNIEPFKIFQNGGLPDYFMIEARRGAIHGDLNLNNILFSTNEETGWLIDFEYSCEDGMVAFDLAKLEAEIWNHFVFSELSKLSGTLTRPVLEFLEAALFAADAGSGGAAVFAARLGLANKELLESFEKLLNAITQVREYGKLIKLGDDELRWARAAYFLVSAKHLEGMCPALAYLASAWNLSFVAPNRDIVIDDVINELTNLDSINSFGNQKIDGLLIEMHERKMN